MHGKAKMKFLSLLLPEEALYELDDLVAKGFFMSRAEAIRTSVYAMLAMLGLMEEEPQGLIKSKKKGKPKIVR